MGINKEAVVQEVGHVPQHRVYTSQVVGVSRQVEMELMGFRWLYSKITCPVKRRHRHHGSHGAKMRLKFGDWTSKATLSV